MVDCQFTNEDFGRKLLVKNFEITLIKGFYLFFKKKKKTLTRDDIVSSY